MVGVVACKEAVVIDDGIDCADLAGGGIDMIKKRENVDLVRHGAGEAVNTQRADCVNSLLQIVGGDLGGEVNKAV